jgi:putative transposase
MQIYRRTQVRLKNKDQKQIARMLNRGWESARVLRRAMMLRQIDQGQTVTQVANQVGVARKTVRAIALRYEAEGLQSALYERPSQNQRIIAMVCGPPPEGQARWSVRLIAREAVKRKLVPKVGREAIRVLLRHHDLKPWREKKLVRGGTE